MIMSLIIAFNISKWFLKQAYIFIALANLEWREVSDLNFIKPTIHYHFKYKKYC